MSNPALPDPMRFYIHPNGHVSYGEPPPGAEIVDRADLWGTVSGPPKCSRDLNPSAIDEMRRMGGNYILPKRRPIP
jgi:hypothetical protein